MAAEAKPKGLAVLLGAKPGAAPAPPGEADAASTAGVDATQAFMDAVQASDAAAAFEAFRDMLSAADGMGSAGEEV